MSVPVVHLTPMRRRHLRAVLRIEGQSGHRGWSLGLFLGELARPEGRRYLVARIDGAVVGFGGVLFGGPDGHITTFAVATAWRRRGVGTRLLLGLARAAIAEGADALTLEVRAGNDPAIALYRGFGFAPAGIRRGYYQETDEDALVMWAHEVDSVGYRDRLARIEAGLGEPSVLEGFGGRVA